MVSCDLDLHFFDGQADFLTSLNVFFMSKTTMIIENVYFIYLPYSLMALIVYQMLLCAL